MPVVAEAMTALGADVRFESPSPTGGVPPYSVACSPASGSIFPIGAKEVRCTASDTAAMQTACTFNVTVRVTRTLSRTRFTAFGDSITEGVVRLAPLVLLETPDTYPGKLEQMLSTAYPTQMFSVFNRGVAGEQTVRGVERLPGVLDADKPEVLLLQEGVNAVLLLSTSAQVAALRDMIRAAQRRGVEVLIATVMPISAARERDRPGTMAMIRALNAGILGLASQYGLGRVVDLFALFEANPQLLGTDGLHPTIEGQTRIAEAFRDEIVRRFESRATMTPQFPDAPRIDVR